MPSTGLNGRKSSVSHGQGPAASNLQGRPGTRRRDTSDSVTGNPLATPTSFGRQTRDDAPLTTPPSSLLRRRTDFKEGNTGSPFDKTRLDTGIDTTSSFGSWKRNVSGPMSAGVTGPSSPWAASGPQSAGFGAFGNFSIDNAGPTPSTPAEKRVGYGSLRGESRFKGLMGRDSSEDISGKSKEKPYIGLEKLAETETEGRGTRPGLDAKKKSNFFSDDERIGSAALGGDEPSPPRAYGSHMDQKRTHDEIGFASINTPSSLGAIRDFVGRRDFTSQEPPQGYHLGEQSHEPMSPTDTNPYQSPQPEKPMDDETDDENRRTPFSLRSQSSKPLTSTYDGDRSQTSSAGQQRPFPGLGGPLGSLTGVGSSGPWSAAPGAIGQQSRTGQGFSSTFAEPLFGAMGDLSSPGAFPTPTSSAFPGGTRSKMGSLFPAQMQDNTRSSETRNESAFPDPRAAFTNVSREPEAPSQSNRVALDDLFRSTDDLRSDPSMMPSPFQMNELGHTMPPQYSTTEATQAQSAGTGPISTPSAAGGSSLLGRSPEPDQGAGQPPPAQQRQMVMPDRMRWIYRDPSGNTQGPFSGLEMHDWYKAGFFSPELQVKKLEDSDYEPLAQLIRRIGNSREPFLVPQIGIPHGQPSGTGVLGAATSGAPPATGQPPFGNNFPSFGTTLTADQQNALERRKQEEQYLMARQKEHLAHTQAYMKQAQMNAMPLHPQQLHHHSSAHSLQSQPSYGSITSPGGFQPAPGQLAGPPSASNMGFFDTPTRSGFSSQGPSSESLATPRDGMLPGIERLTFGPPGQNAFGGMARPQDVYNHQQQVTSMMQDRARLQTQQKHWDSMQKGDGRENAERLEQFNQLRTQQDDDQVIRPPSGPIARPTNLDNAPFAEQQQPSDHAFSQQGQFQSDLPTYDQSQQMPQDIAPQPPTSPLPAPAAQRTRQQFAEVLAVDSGSRPQSPVETPTTASLAPWAKESTEPSKGPSLKEIQEIEARKTAQREELAAASRRAAAEQERIAAAQASVQAPAPGLPSSANWAASSPVTSTSGPVPWAKPAAGKATAPTTSAKKSIAQIQKEEEARKNRAAAAAAAAASANAAAATTAPGGKRYADLASKVAAPVVPANAGGAWTTVGASGKAKAPASPALPSSTPQRTGSGNGQVSSAATSTKSKSAVPTRSNASAISAQSANEEFQKWVKNSLGKGLNSGVNGRSKE